MRSAILLVFLAVCLPACVPQQMQRQAKYQPYGEASLFPDGAMMRPLVPGTVPYGRRRQYIVDAGATAPAAAGLEAPLVPVDATPPPVTMALLATGKARYETFCAPCHGLGGRGDGVIVQHGFPAPPSFHGDRLRAAPEGHFYAVITQGYGVMYSYAARVRPEERWAIIAYVRALQLAGHGRMADVPEAERPRLRAPGAAPAVPDQVGTGAGLGMGTGTGAGAPPGGMTAP